jgi:hypothetical protein
MAVTMFAGTLVGTILGLAVQNRRNPISNYLFGLHPILGNLIGLVLVSLLLLAPVLVLSGAITITAPAFFWGGCFAYSLIITFGLTCLTIHPSKAHKHHVRHSG